MKTLNIKVHPASSKNQVLTSQTPDIDLDIYTTATAHDNKANLSVIKLLSKHLKIPKSKLIIIKGKKSKIKTISISD